MTDTPLEPGRTALINVHWQHDIVTPTGAFGPFFAESVARRGVVEKTRRLTETARATGMLVVWARAAFRPGHPELHLNCGLNQAVKDMGALVDGTLGACIIDDLAPLPDEPVVSHPGTSAFGTSALDPMLRAKQIGTVLFTGVATNVTVEGTARDAVNLGYRTVIVDDACAAADDAAHDATLATFQLLGRTTTVDELISPAATAS